MRKRRRRIRRWAWARRLTAASFLTLLILGSFSWFPWFGGSMSGTTLLDVVPFTDPLAALEVTIASRALHMQMLIGAGLLIAAALLLGPVFCGWICPLGLLLDINQWVRSLAMRLFRRRRRLDPLSGPVPAEVRYAMLGVMLAFAAVARFPLFQILSPINILVRSIIFFTSWALLIVAVIVVLEYVWPRFWCRTLCPLGALYSLIGRFGLLRIRIDPALAGKTRCRLCTGACPMGIGVMEDYALQHKPSVDHPSCIRCGDCIDACPRSVLKLSFFNRFKSARSSVAVTPMADNANYD